MRLSRFRVSYMAQTERDWRQFVDAIKAAGSRRARRDTELSYEMTIARIFGP